MLCCIISCVTHSSKADSVLLLVTPTPALRQAAAAAAAPEEFLKNIFSATLALYEEQLHFFYQEPDTLL